MRINSAPRVVGTVAAPAISQTFSSASNFLLILAAARFIAPAELGIVAVVQTVIIASTGIQRGLIAEPYLVLRAHTKQSGSLAWALGALAGGLLASLALISPGALDARSIFVAGTVPAVVAGRVDFARYRHISRGDWSRVALLDAVWLGGSLLALSALVVLRPSPSGASVVLCWSLGPWMALAVDRWRGSNHEEPDSVQRPPTEHLRHWLTLGNRLPAWLGAQSVLAAVSSVAIVSLIAALAGPAELGGLRTMQTFLMPVGAIAPVCLPALTSVASRAPSAFRPGLTAGLLMSLGGVAVMVLAAGSGRLVPLVFGDAWLRFRPLLLPLSVAVVAQIGASVPGAQLRARVSGRAVLLTQLFGTCIGIVTLAVLTVRWGALGAAVGLAVQAIAVGLISTSYAKKASQ